MDYETRLRISNLSDDLLDAGDDPPAAVLDEILGLLEAVPRAVADDLAETLALVLRTTQAMGAKVNGERALTDYRQRSRNVHIPSTTDPESA